MGNTIKNGKSDKIFEEAKLTWTLRKSEVMERDGPHSIYSQIFPHGQRKHKWRLELVPPLKPHHSSIGLFLERKFDTSTEVFIKYTFRLKNVNNEILAEIQKDVIVNIQRLYVPWYINVNTLSSVKSYDNITISAVILLQVLTLQSYHTLSVETEEYASNMSDDFEAILKSGEFSDFVISLEDGEIPVHRAILAARCPYFSAMFKYSMSESKLECAKMAGVDKTTAFNLLKFIYTGEANLTKDEAKKLLPVTDQYGISPLKNVCAEILSENLLASDIPDILILAELSNCLNLKQTVLQYIAKNPTEFNVLSIFSEAKKYPNLITEIHQ